MKLLNSLTLVGKALAHSLETRLELFTAELEYERLKVVRWLIFCALGSAALGTSLFTGTALLFYFVDVEHRVVFLLVATATLLLGGIGCIVFALRMWGGGRKPFEASTKALKEDFECLASLTKD